MNAVVTIEAGAPATGYDEWLGRGQVLVQRRVEADWALGDWLVEGQKADYLCQQKFAFLADSLGIKPKQVQDVKLAAETFPPALRDARHSVERHAIAARLPKNEALKILKTASKEQDIREAVTQYRLENGELFANDDISSSLATIMRRAWNRGDDAARKEFFEDVEWSAAHGFCIIDEDEIHDDA